MKYTYTEKKDTRSGFGAGLAELADKNPNVVALCADLIGSLKMEKFIWFTRAKYKMPVVIKSSLETFNFMI